MNYAAILLSLTLSSPSVQVLPERFALIEAESPVPQQSVDSVSERPWAPLAAIAIGVGLMVGGLAVMTFDDGCQTRDADFRCNDPRGGSVVMPSLVVLGLAFTVTGEHWRRTTEPREP